MTTTTKGSAMKTDRKPTNEYQPHEFGYVFIFRELTDPKEIASHAHYASNAQACGHSARCAKVTTPVNWPTLFGRPGCTCGAEKASR